MKPGEIICELPVPPVLPKPLTRIRSTVVTSALAELRQRGHIERYTAALAPAHRDALLTMVAGLWLPIDIVLAHYAACDTLQLSYDESFAIGMSVGSRMQENVLHLVRHLAVGAGVTPWTAAARYDALWTRLFDGGGFRLTKIGPKEGRTEFFRLPLAQSPYFRSAFCGVTLAATSFFTTKAYVRVQSFTQDGLVMRSSWV